MYCSDAQCQQVFSLAGVTLGLSLLATGCVSTAGAWVVPHIVPHPAVSPWARPGGPLRPVRQLWCTTSCGKSTSLLCPELMQEGESGISSSVGNSSGLKDTFSTGSITWKKKGKKKKRILRLVSLSLFLVTLMFCFYLNDSEFVSVAMHAHKACCCRTHSVSLKAEGVKPLLNGPIHANKELWKWSSQQTPGYYPSIWHPQRTRAMMSFID